MTDKKQQARHLYLTGNFTQKQIAIEVGVSERTIYTWVHQYAWQKLKTAALQAPATIVDQLSSQLVELNLAIASREPGKRIPNKEESEITQRLIRGIGSMKGTQSLGANMQMMQAFREYVRPLNTRFSEQLAHFADGFFTKKSRAGYSPYQMEYGIEQFAAIMPINDELEGDFPVDIPTPTNEPITCCSLSTCQNKGNCRYPDCTRAYRPGDFAMNAGTKEEPWALPSTPIQTANPTSQIQNHNPNSQLQIPNSILNQTGSNPAVLLPEPAIKEEKPSEEELLKSWREVCEEISDSDKITDAGIIPSPKTLAISIPSPNFQSPIPQKELIQIPKSEFPIPNPIGSNPAISQSEPAIKNTLPDQKSKVKSPQNPTIHLPNASHPIPISEFKIPNPNSVPRILQFRNKPPEFPLF